MKWVEVFKHSWADFKQAKQNCVLHSRHDIILHPSLCSISTPQNGQARMAGHWTWTLESLYTTDDKVIIGQSLSRSWSALLHPTFPHWSARGRGPFHSLSHCQQNSKILLVLSVQTEHSTQRLKTSDLSMKVPQSGHWIWEGKRQICTSVCSESLTQTIIVLILSFFTALDSDCSDTIV